MGRRCVQYKYRIHLQEQQQSRHSSLTFNSICRSERLVLVFSARIFPNVFFHSFAWSIMFRINGLRFILWWKWAGEAKNDYNSQL